MLLEGRQQLFRRKKGNACNLKMGENNAVDYLTWTVTVDLPSNFYPLSGYHDSDISRFYYVALNKPLDGNLN